jgi:hypothetical protein
VITFIAPILTAFSGAIFLKEALSLKEICAGGMCFQAVSAVFAIHNVSVCSFFGVILIARPQFLFGTPQSEPSRAVAPGKRTLSVASEGSYRVSKCSLMLSIVRLSSAPWRPLPPVGILSATRFIRSSLCFTDTVLRAVGEQAHPLHSLSFFASQCVLMSTIGYVPAPIFKEPFDTVHPSMIIFKIPPVIPKDVLCLVMPLLICILGSIAQVRALHPLHLLI